MKIDLEKVEQFYYESAEDYHLWDEEDKGPYPIERMLNSMSNFIKTAKGLSLIKLIKVSDRNDIEKSFFRIEEGFSVEGWSKLDDVKEGSIVYLTLSKDQSYFKTSMIEEIMKKSDDEMVFKTKNSIYNLKILKNAI